MVLPKSTSAKPPGDSFAAGCIAFVLFLIYLAVAIGLITWITGIVNRQAATFEATTCYLFGSVWDLPIVSYGPCTAAALVRWGNALLAMADMDLAPGTPITARVLWTDGEGVAVIICMLSIPGTLVWMLAKACGSAGEQMVANYRARVVSASRSKPVAERQEPRG